jgi:hypothetical protein
LSRKDLPDNPEADSTSGVRRRVLNHARKLLTAGAVAATVAADKPREPAGYMVVDMLPAPAKCHPNHWADYTFTAFASRRGDNVVVRIAARIWTVSGPVAFEYGKPSSIRGGLLIAQTPEGADTSIEIRPLKSAKALVVSLPVRCEGKGPTPDDELSFRVDLNSEGRLKTTVHAPGVTAEDSEPKPE